MVQQTTKSVARSAKREANRTAPPIPKIPTNDSYYNYATRTGYGSGNQNDFGSYGFYPITRLRIILDFAYRSSWICRTGVEAVAEDMTRQGFQLGSDMDPSDAEKIHSAFNNEFAIWDRLCDAICWARLYGGAGIYVMVDGQKPDTPLRVDVIDKEQFCGLLPLDRWLVQPSLTDLVTNQRSPDFGKPKFYTTVGDTPLPPNTKIHHSRFIRFEGSKLPYYQRLSENLWDMSVLEPLWDRLLAFDATTSGTAQLVNRASIRNLYIEKWKEVVGSGGDLLQAQLASIEMIRMFQQNEGITVLDSNDKFEALTYSFVGLDAVLIQMGQQISGALGIPLVRLFGQSPVGLNSTGESDIRNYYDMIKSQQERKFRSKIEYILRIICASKSIKIPDGFSWTFSPLWQLQEQEKVNIGAGITQQVLQAFEAGAITERSLVLKELKQQSHRTGIWTNITEEMIADAENEPPVQMGQQGIGEPPGPDNFLPGGHPGGGEGTAESPPENNFLPGSAQGVQKKASFLPGNKPAMDQVLLNELEELDPKVKKPLFHIYINDQDKPDRESA